MPAGYCVRIEVWVGVYQETLNAVLCHVCLTLAVFKNSVISHTDNSLCDQASVRVQKQNNIFYVYTKQYDTVSYYVFYEIRPCLLRIISGVMRFNQIKPRFSNQSHWCVVFRSNRATIRRTYMSQGQILSCVKCLNPVVGTKNAQA